MSLVWDLLETVVRRESEELVSKWDLYNLDVVVSCMLMVPLKVLYPHLDRSQFM